MVGVYSNYFLNWNGNKRSILQSFLICKIHKLQKLMFLIQSVLCGKLKFNYWCVIHSWSCKHWRNRWEYLNQVWTLKGILILAPLTTSLQLQLLFKILAADTSWSHFVSWTRTRKQVRYPEFFLHCLEWFLSSLNFSYVPTNKVIRKYLLAQGCVRWQDA